MNSKASWFNESQHMAGIWQMEGTHSRHQQHTFKWISHRHFAEYIFSFSGVSVFEEKKLHTSFPLNQKRLCEVHKDGGEREHFTDPQKVFFFFYLCMKRAAEKDKKKWEARKEKGGKPVSLTKKCKVRKQRLLTSPSLARCPHLGFWTTARYRKLLPSTVHIRRLTPQGAETGILCQHHNKLRKTWLHMFYQCKCIEMVEI